MEQFLLTFYDDTYIIVIYSFLLLIIALLKFRKNTKEKNIFTCENLFIMFYYVFIAIGPILLVTIYNYEYNYNVFFIFLISLVFYIIGADFIVGNKIIKTNRKITIFKIKDENLKYAKQSAICLLIFSYFFAIFYLYKNISFIFQDFENNRVLAMQGSGILVHFSYIMLPATWILYYYNLHYKKDIKIYLVFIIDFILLLLIGFRSRILELLLVSIIIRNNYKPFKLKRLFKYGILLIIFVTILQLVRTYISEGSIKIGIDSLVNVLAVGSINLKSIFRCFPYQVPFQHGYTYWLSFAILSPNSHMDATLWLKEALNISFSGGGVTPTILGEFYINFGYYGMFLGMLIIGIITRLIDNYAAKNNTNKIIYFIFMFYMARSVGSGISNFIIILLWFMLVSYFALKFKIKDVKDYDVKKNINENIFVNNNENIKN